MSVFPHRAFSSRLVSSFFLAGSLLMISASCSKKDKEPESKPTEPAAAVAAAAAPTQPRTPPPVLAKCEPGADGKCAASALCSPDCKPLSSAECAKCEAAGDCAPFATICDSPLLSDADKKLCFDIQTCVVESRCFEGPKATVGACYCGALDTKACLAAPMTGPKAPNGACHDLILKGFPKAKNQSQVLGNVTTRDADHPSGMALSRFNCQKLGYKRTCSEVCGWGPR